MSLVTFEKIKRRLLTVRGQRVMLSHDLAELYGVETRALVQAVRRNARRFPSDFMFQLSREDVESLRSQIVISNVLDALVKPSAERKAIGFGR